MIEREKMFETAKEAQITPTPRSVATRLHVLGSCCYSHGGLELVDPSRGWLGPALITTDKNYFLDKLVSSCFLETKPF